MRSLGHVAFPRRLPSPAGTGPHPYLFGALTTPTSGSNGGGNRQVSAALHRIALTQWRCAGTPGHDYLIKRNDERDNKKEALRLLRPRLSDEVFRRLLTDEAGVSSISGEESRRAA